MDKPIHVKLDQLAELLKGLDLGDVKRNARLEARWLHYVEWWDSRSRGAKWKYQWLRGAVVVAGALVPALVGLRELKAWGQYDSVFAVASIVASLVVAICAGLEGLYNFGGIWREKRAAVELLTSEGFSFFHLSGGYERFPTHASAYKQFTSNVEKLIRKEIKDYIEIVSTLPPSGGGGGGQASSPPRHDGDEGGSNKPSALPGKSSEESNPPPNDPAESE
jgi:hypothetical protein